LYEDDDGYYYEDDYDYDDYEKFGRPVPPYGTESPGDFFVGDGAPGDGRPEWERVEGGAAEVLWPTGAWLDRPKAIVHFIGGTGVGSVSPRAAYGPLLEGLASAGSVVVATPVPGPLGQLRAQFDHAYLAAECRRRFETAYAAVLEDEYGAAGAADLPLLGVGHSLGCRLHLLLGCNYDAAGRRRRGRRDVRAADANVLLAFNNRPAAESVPYLRAASAFVTDADRFRRNVLAPAADGAADALADGIYAVRRASRVGGLVGRALELAEEVPHALSDFIGGYGDADDDDGGRRRDDGDDGPSVPVEFHPNPEELWEDVRSNYAIRSNLLVQFDRDDIDQSPRLAEVLDGRTGADAGDGTDGLRYARLPGTHVTPNWVGVAQRRRRGADVPGFDPTVTNVHDPLRNHGMLVDSVVAYIDYVTGNDHTEEAGEERAEAAAAAEEEEGP